MAYIKIKTEKGYAYFQETPGGLTTVNDPVVLKGLQNGTIKAGEQGAVAGDANRFVTPSPGAVKATVPGVASPTPTPAAPTLAASTSTAAAAIAASAGKTTYVPPEPPKQPEFLPPAASLTNLRIALRSAAEEAGKTRMANALGQFGAAGLGKTPGTLGSIADIVRGSAAPSVRGIFSDVMTGVREFQQAKQKEIDRINEMRQNDYNRANDRYYAALIRETENMYDNKQREMDRINELRAEFGSAIPANVTDLATALSLIQPLIDAERDLDKKIKLADLAKKLKSDQAEDSDIESWAEYIAGGGAVGNVPSSIRTAARVRADQLTDKRELEAKQEYKDKIAFRLERKTTDFETERNLVIQDNNLTTEEQREILDYIDSLEQQQKNAKGQGGLFSFLNPSASAAPPPPVPEYGQGNFKNIHIDDRIAQLKKAVGPQLATNKYLEDQLLKDGYNPEAIKRRTRTGILDQAGAALKGIFK